MKKLNRRTAVAILVIVALLAVPLLGGLRLSLDHRSVAGKFTRIVTETDRHGNDLFTDTDKLTEAARALLSAGGDTTSSAALSAAIDAVTSARDAVSRYDAYERLALAARSYISAAGGALEGHASEIESRTAIIDRTYRRAYTDYIVEKNALVSGFPASLLAKLFRIGG